MVTVVVVVVVEGEVGKEDEEEKRPNSPRNAWKLVESTGSLL